MQNVRGLEEIKRVDPIWKYMPVQRIKLAIWALTLLGYLVLIIFTFVETKQILVWWLFYGLIILLSTGTNIFNSVRMERYWRSIGERRLMAQQDPEPFQTRSQPMLYEVNPHMPVTIRLRWKRSILAIPAVMLLLVFIAPLIIGFSIGSRGHIDVTLWLLVLGIGLAAVVIIYIIVYLLSLRYQPCSIELDDEGITTSYLHQKRSLRWEDATMFAQYPQSVVNRAINGLVFELSNGQTIVRWSQRRITKPYFIIESNLPDVDDYNHALGQINAYVVARTGLPLLDLDDNNSQKQAGSTSLTGGTQNLRTNAASQAGNQGDPITPHLHLNGTQIWAFVFLIILGIGAIATGILSRINPHRMGPIGSGSMIISNLMLLAGACFLISPISIFVLVRFTHRYWGRIQKQRQQALQQPERFLAQVQPGASTEPPQPRVINLQPGRLFFFSKNGAIIFLIVAIIALLIFMPTSLPYFLLILLASLLLSLFSTFLTLSMNIRSRQMQIEINTYEIYSRISVMESHLNWQDARSFVSYQGMRLLPGRSSIRIYELSSEHTTVRWHHYKAGSYRQMQTRPAMRQTEYDRWLEQMCGYIVERTGLPLLDLDRQNVQP